MYIDKRLSMKLYLWKGCFISWLRSVIIAPHPDGKHLINRALPVNLTVSPAGKKRTF